MSPSIIDDQPNADADNSCQEALNLLRAFLENYQSTFQGSKRCECPCCGASRSIYCYDCCQVLLPKEQQPLGLRDLRLPFSVDFILQERKASATGVQAISVLKQVATGGNVHRLFDQSVPSDDPISAIPDYSNMQGAYFLFPSETSVRLSSVASQVRHLVVLDCKWTKSSLRSDPRLLVLPQVHLDNPPQESFFWRWHTSGKGMLSSIEALYFAAWQVAQRKKWTSEQQRPLVNLMWVFGVQRAMIQRQYEAGKGHNHIPYLPFSEDGKACARKLRDRGDASVAKKKPDSE